MLIAKRMLLTTNLSLWFTLTILTSKAQEDITIGTSYGEVKGKSIILEDGSIVDSFMGVPYAKPPDADARFELSELIEPWAEVFDATEPKHSCFTVSSGVAENFNSSEDCLHINIYSPQRSDPDELLPVMFYIHGGGYTSGVNNLYPGYFLARKGVVMVTANYRLGILGFAYTGDSIIPGNMGLMDQVLALTFVQEIISDFGGDPSQVTIFGESAGASSVAQLTMIPYAQGLFHSAILESGCELSSFSTNLPEIEPENFIIQVAEAFGCPTDNSETMKMCLQNQDAQLLMDAEILNPPGYRKYASFVPVIDGDVIPDTYENLRARGEYIQVPEMIGLNEKESSYFLYGLPDRDRAIDIVTNGLNRSDFNEILWLATLNISAAWPETTNPVDVYAAFNWFYADWPYYEDPERNRDMLIDIIDDYMFGWSLDAHCKYNILDGLAVYYYVYDYVFDWPRMPEWWGACHAMEVYGVFGNPYLQMPENQMAYNHSQLRLSVEHSAYDADYSEFMMNLWTNFAKYGNPTPEGTVGPNGTRITWPLFTTKELNYINFKPDPQVKQNYRQKEYAFWREYLPYLIYGEEAKGHHITNFFGIDNSNFNRQLLDPFEIDYIKGNISN